MTDRDVARRHAGCRYAGPDRRTSPPVEASRASSELPALVLTLAVLAGIGIAIGWDILDGRGPDQIQAAIALGAAGALAAVATAVAVASYRQSGRSAEIWIAAAFAVISAGAVIDAASFVHAPSFADAGPLTARHSLASVVALLLAARAVYGPMVDSRVTPSRAALTAAVVLAAVTLLVLVAAGALVAHYQPGAGGLDALRRLGRLAAWASAGSALVVVATTLRRSAAPHHVFVLGCFAVTAWLPLLLPGSADGEAFTRVLVAALAAVVATLAGLRGLCRTAATQARVILTDRMRVAAREYEVEADLFRREERDHDLRSGLFAIEAGLATIVSSPDDSAATGRIAAEVSIETARLRRMLEDSGTTGQPAVADVRTALAPVLLLERSRGVEVHAEITADARAVIPSDVLVRVVHVLLDNVRRHAPGARVDVRARRRDDHVEVTVRDDGGSGPRVARHCESSFDERDDGTRHGLGLLSASRLVEEHGGLLRSDRGPGRGMVFTILLPLDRSGARLHTAPDLRIVGRRFTDRRVSA